MFVKLNIFFYLNIAKNLLQKIILKKKNEKNGKKIIRVYFQALESSLVQIVASKVS